MVKFRTGQHRKEGGDGARSGRLQPFPRYGKGTPHSPPHRHSRDYCPGLP